MNTTDDDHDHDRGLDFDLPLLINRRRALGLMAGSVGAVALAACGADSGATTGSSATAEAASGNTSVPEETPGPFPGDGSNGPNVLTEGGVVRRDITTSFGGASGTADGLPATVDLQLVDVAGGGGPLAGAAVYLWHCNRDGQYSLYDPAISDQNYLRGVQVSDQGGALSFASIFPGAYSGRWPHMHFEVYDSLDAATAASTKLRTSQIALPKDACDVVYTTDGYEQSLQNLAQTSLDTDLVFSDGYASELASWAGDADKGISLSLNVGI